jgi:predicted Zn finger-like uncharacterized protein
MKVSCQSCGAKYTIADDKVQGRRVKVRCKSCRTPIVVDGNQPGTDGGTEPAGTTDIDMVVTETDPAPDAWEVNLSDTEQRRMTSDEIRDGWRAGVVTSDAFVWKDGFEDWKPVLEVAELKALLEPEAVPAQVQPPAAASSFAAGTPTAPLTMPKSASFPAAPSAKTTAAKPVPAAVRTSSGRGSATADLFSSLAADDPAGGKDDDKATGARNENSVLFSLDALKAGFTPAGKEAPAPKRVEKKSGLDDLMNIGGNSPLFLDNQALLTAPAAAPESPKKVAKEAAPAAAMSRPAAATATPRAGSKKKLIVIAAAAAAALLVIGLLVAGGGKKDDPAVAANQDTAAVAEPVTKPAPEAARAEPAPTPTPEAKGPEPAKEEVKAAEAAPPAETAPKPEPAAAAPKLAAGTPSKTPDKAADKPAAAAAGPFDTGAAKAALGGAAGGVGRCKKPGGPTGSGKVQVTFAPSGRVTSATVAGAPFAGTPVGGCVASVFRGARVPPFSGSAVTVSKSFSIN